MNKGIITLLLALSCITSNAQFDYQAEIQNSITFPKSPEAWAFEKYGNTNVNLYTGNPDIQIPLHTIQGRELSLPISLTYDASGIKVEQLATTAGLGWNLNVGGRISLMANGEPDGSNTYTPASAVIRQQIALYSQNRTEFNSQQELDDYTDFVQRVASGQYDTQLDYYSLNVLGISDYIVFDLETYEPMPLMNPRLKIIADKDVNGIVEGWVITGDDGTQYFFGQESNSMETTHMIGNDVQGSYNIGKDYVSSWLLKKIVSANKKDEYLFAYDEFNWLQNYNMANASSQSFRIDPITGNTDPPTTNYNVQLNYRVDQMAIANISHNGVSMVTMEYGQRDDIIFTNSSGNALKKITADFQTHRKEIDFEQTYFGLVNSNNFWDKRLKLDGLIFTSFNKENNAYDTEERKYYFEYINPFSVPAIISYSRDYLGYFNGKNNTSLIPTYNSGSINVSNRTPDITKSLNGTLNKITYPTGGSTVFEYGEHSAINEQEQSENVTNTFGTVSVASNVATSDDNLNYCIYEPASSLVDYNTRTFEIEEEGDYVVELSGANGMGFIHQIGETYECYEFQDPPANYNPSVDGPLPCLNGGFTGGEKDVSTICPGDGTSVWESLVTTTQTITLTKGFYQTTVFNVDSDLVVPGGSYPIIKLQLSKEFTVPLPSNGIAGFRVNKITDYTSQNKVASTRIYDYVLVDGLPDIFQDNQSGFLLNDINDYLGNSYTRRLEAVTNTSNNTCSQIPVEYITLSSYPTKNLGTGPHIAYKKVNVSQVDAEGNTNGFTSHLFEVGNSGMIGVGNGLIYQNLPSKGKELETLTYTGDNPKKLINKQERAYDFFDYDVDVLGNDTGFFNTFTGFYPKKEANGEQKFLVSYRLSGTYRYTFVDAEWKCRFGDSGPGCCPLPQQPQSLEFIVPPGATNIQIRTAMGAYSYSLIHLGASARNGSLVNEVNTSYFDTSEVITEKNYMYTSDSHFQVASVTQITSDDKKIRSNYSYPNSDGLIDLSEPPIVFSTTGLEESNRLTEVIETSTVELDNNDNETRFISGYRKDYVLLNNDDIIVPSKIWTSKDGNAEVNFIERANLFYYDNGNLKSSKQPNGTTTFYIWGYDDQYPIAKIENAESTDYSGLPFGVAIDQLSNLDNDRTIGDIGAEGALRAAMRDLRNQLSDNQMLTTYTYDPQIGVTSITDPKGYTMYYIYDDFNRLVEVRDADNNIVTDYDYAFKN